MPRTILALVFLATPAHAHDGTEIGILSEGMAEGEWAELTTVNADLFAGHDSIFEYSDELVWDSVTRKAYFVGTSHPNEEDTDGKFVEYAAATNTWSTLVDPPFLPTSAIMHAYDHHAIDVVGRVLYYKPFGSSRNFWAYDLGGATWSETTPIPSVGVVQYITGASSMVFFPERGTVIFQTSNADANLGRAILEFTPGSSGGSWADISGFLTPYASLHSVMEYNPVHQIVVFGGGNGGDVTTELWRLAVDGTITPIGTGPANITNIATSTNGSLFTTDPVSGDQLLLGSDDSFWQLDPMTGAWQALTGGSAVPMFVNPPNADPAFHTVAAPVDTYGVVMIAQWRTGGSKVWLYKHASRPPDTTAPAPPTGLQVQ